MNNLYRHAAAITGLISNTGVGRVSLWELSGFPLDKSALTYDVWGAIFIPVWLANYPEVMGCWRRKRKAAGGKCICAACVKSDWSMQRLLSIYILLIRNWLSLGKMNLKNRERKSMREERWWQIRLRQAHTSKLGLGCLWCRGCELSVNIKLSKWKSILCVCVLLVSTVRIQRAAERDGQGGRCRNVCVSLT